MGTLDDNVLKYLISQLASLPSFRIIDLPCPSEFFQVLQSHNWTVSLELLKMAAEPANGMVEYEELEQEHKAQEIGVGKVWRIEKV